MRIVLPFNILYKKLDTYIIRTRGNRPILSLGMYVYRCRYLDSQNGSVINSTQTLLLSMFKYYFSC